MTRIRIASDVGSSQSRVLRVLFSLAVALFVAVPAVRAEWHHVGPVTQIHSIANGVVLDVGPARLKVVALTDSVIRVRLAPQGKFPDDYSWAVLPGTEAPVHTKLERTKSGWELSTPAVKIRISKSPLELVFVDSAGHVLAQDDPDQPMAWDGARVRVWKVMPADEHYFGLGDKPGSFDHRGHAYAMWNYDYYNWQESSDPLYKSIPFFLGLQRGVSYGIFFDNTYRSSFDFGKEFRDAYSFGAEGGEINYYFLAGPRPKQVLEEYSTLTGRTPLPPLWSLGYQQSRYSYYPEARVRDLAKTFREKKIPADVIYLDIDYMDGYRSFTVNRQYFPHFEEMLAELARQGFEIVCIIDPGIKKEPGYAVYDQGIAGNDFIRNPDSSLFEGQVWPGLCVFPDFAGEKVREWWGSLYAGLVAKGVRGFWNDMNEPAIFGRPDKTMSLDAVHRAEGRTLEHRAFHNVYGMEMARATFEGLRKLRPDDRPFVLTRAAFAGAQRYAATWTGDNSSSWNHLRLSVRTLLNLGLSGYPFVGADVGGFIGNATPDLVTRWTELGAFTPLFRNHKEKGASDQEPWVHGPVHEAIRKRYIELRYRLMPFVYTALEESSRTGIPAMRPLWLEYPEQEDLYGNDQEFIFGRDVLVAPKLLETEEPYSVTLPGGEWYDYWTDAKIQGGHSIRVAPALDVLPLYIRAGAILPQQPVVQNTKEAPQGPLELRVYPGPDCRGSQYLDDGKSYAFMQGAFLRMHYSCQVASGSMTVAASPREGSYMPWWKQIQLEIFGVERRPSEVRWNGRIIADWVFDPARNEVTWTAADSPSGWRAVLLF